jgi:SAM-dependent methyltransferase
MINIRRIIYILRIKGIVGVKKYIELNFFENRVLGNKTVKWCDDGYWKMDPMPTQEDLDKYYQEVYWFSNSDYKNDIVVGRDLKHAEFIKHEIAESFPDVKNFLNYGAGHGGVSYLFHPLGFNIFNIEPGGLDTFNLNNFYAYKNINELNEANPNILFDVIYASHVIEHLRDPIEFFLPAIDLLNQNGKIILEVPNTRILNPDKEYFEGGCDGKTTGSHTLYFTKDFFENLGAKIFFYGGDYNKADYPKVSSEDNANFIRAVIDFEGIRKYLSSKDLIN